MMNKEILVEAREFAQTALEQLEIIDTVQLAARKLDREAVAVSNARRWLDKLIERATFWERDGGD